MSRFDRADIGVLRDERRTRVQLLAAFRTICTVLPLIAIAGALSLEALGPLQRLGDWLGNVGQQLPLSQVISTPVAWLREAASASEFVAWTAAFGEAVVITGLALSLLLSARVTSSGKSKRRDRVMSSLNLLLTALAVASSGILLAAQEWYLDVIRGAQEIRLLDRFGIDSQALNNVVLIGTTVVFAAAAWALLRLLRRVATRTYRIVELVGQAVLIAALVAMPIAAVIAAAVAPQLGRAVLAAVLLYGAFALLKVLGHWRWDRWERTVRNAVLDGSLPPKGTVPIASLGALAITAVGLTAATFVGPAIGTAWLIVLLSSLVLLATLFLTLAWDAYSNAPRTREGYAGSNLIPD